MKEKEKQSENKIENKQEQKDSKYNQKECFQGINIDSVMLQYALLKYI